MHLQHFDPSVQQKLRGQKESLQSSRFTYFNPKNPLNYMNPPSLSAISQKVKNSPRPVTTQKIYSDVDKENYGYKDKKIELKKDLQRMQHDLDSA